jgi:hypothetical protein
MLERSHSVKRQLEGSGQKNAPESKRQKARDAHHLWLSNDQGGSTSQAEPDLELRLGLPSRLSGEHKEKTPRRGIGVKELTNDLIKKDPHYREIIYNMARELAMESQNKE